MVSQQTAFFWILFTVLTESGVGQRLNMMLPSIQQTSGHMLGWVPPVELRYDTRQVERIKSMMEDEMKHKHADIPQKAKPKNFQQEMNKLIDSRKLIHKLFKNDSPYNPMFTAPFSLPNRKRDADDEEIETSEDLKTPRSEKNRDEWVRKKAMEIRGRRWGELQRLHKKRESDINVMNENRVKDFYQLAGHQYCARCAEFSRKAAWKSPSFANKYRLQPFHWFPPSCQRPAGINRESAAFCEVMGPRYCTDCTRLNHQQFDRQQYSRLYPHYLHDWRCLGIPMCTYQQYHPKNWNT